MTLQEAKTNYGATHYAVMKDGVTPQMAYKQELVKWNDGTESLRWVYLTFANLWHASSMTREEIAQLKEIK